MLADVSIYYNSIYYKNTQVLFVSAGRISTLISYVMGTIVDRVVTCLYQLSYT